MADYLDYCECKVRKPVLDDTRKEFCVSCGRVFISSSETSKMTTGKKIIHNLLLSREEAEQVYQDLDTLYTKGVWDKPGWAHQLSDYHNVEATDTTVQVVAWRAVAKSFWEGI